jgi:fatty-acyl-CoA synthase
VSGPLEHCELLAPPPPELAERVIGDVLARAARLGPTDPLLRTATPREERAWTAADLLADAERVAAGLLARHEPDTRIATCLANGPEAVLLQFGVALAGMAPMTASTKIQRAELRRMAAADPDLRPTGTS